MQMLALTQLATLAFTSSFKLPLQQESCCKSWHAFAEGIAKSTGVHWVTVTELRGDKQSLESKIA